uniref:HAT C-terminal dimerisation domain-containing protein n=1 Tax=Amphiprion percula TaxID=161767 RepID=A0A3P8TK50_AMPPE
MDKSMSAPKRELDQENSIFQVRWETDYLVTEFKGKPICLVCLETTSAKKDFNSSGHYNTTHKEKFEKYTRVARAAVVADLKGTIHRQQSLFTKTTAAQESALKAYVVTLELTKAKKPLSDGEMVKRIFDIQNHVEEKLKQVMNDCKYFSLALDESTDVTDVSQLLIFTRTIDSSSEVHEELLKLVSLHETTKGTDIFKAVKTVVNEHGGFGKLSAIVTDGAPSMQGRRVGFTGLLHQNGVDYPVLHCIIHQEAICAKTMNFSHVVDLVTKVTDLIRGGNRALNHRNLVAFLEEVNAAYGDLQMHADIRWMSRGKFGEVFCACLRCDTSAYCCKLQDTAFLCDMAFLTDITSHLNHLNIQLQGRCQTVPDLYAHMNAFRRKLELLRDGFSSVSPNLAHFPSCEEMCTDVPACEKIFPMYRADTETLLQQFTTSCAVHSILSAVVNEQPAELQLELSELRSDPFFQSPRNEKEISFWSLLPESRFPLLRDFSLSMASMFGSTYICESSFSTMKHINSKERNRLTDETIPYDENSQIQCGTR